MALAYGVNNYLSGIVVAKLPFEPMSMVSGMSHRNLSGDDMREVNLFFFFTLFSTGLRGTINKILGIDHPRQPMDQMIPKWAKEYQDGARN